MKDNKYSITGPRPVSTDQPFTEAAQHETILGDESVSKSWALFSRILVAILATSLFLLTTIFLDAHLPQFHRFMRTPATQDCVSTVTRREWRMLSANERQDFIAAIRCLHNQPSRLGLSATRYDDFVYIHVLKYSQAHNVAPSLPWHRYFIHVFEKALRNECGFKGYLPYWDWTIDSLAPENSPIWSSHNGFGGNGDIETGCIQDGPFADFRPLFPDSHCLKRNFASGMNGFNYTANLIQDLWQDPGSYHQFRSRLESGPHKSVHNGIGGEMPTDGSPNDPIFYVHHGQIDRLWWLWQQANPLRRVKEYFGPREANGNSSGLFNATIEDKIALLGLDEDVTVLDVMRTDSTLLCYRY